MGIISQQALEGPLFCFVLACQVINSDYIKIRLSLPSSNYLGLHFIVLFHQIICGGELKQIELM